MARYCDTDVLEKNWYNWLIAQATPCLDNYRNAGLLMTKIIAKVTLRPDHTPNPFWGYPDDPRRSHVIVVDRPVYCNSYNGRCDKPRTFTGSRPSTCQLPPTISIPNGGIVDKMLSQGYVLEQPIRPAWDAILIDVQNICKGISLKFNLPSEDHRDDLAGEAFLQVTNKIKNCKLVYTPGLAPVFNLLTTTIHRVMFSLLNKSTKERENRADHAKLLAPLMNIGQTRPRGRMVTRRAYGTVVACSNR